MRQFLADECVFASTVCLMRELGLKVHRVQELGLRGAKDWEIFQEAQRRQAVLVTNDRGFGDVRLYPPSSHHGINVLKMEPDPERVKAVHRVLRRLLEQEEKIEGCLFVVDGNKYRKRMQP